MLYRKFLLRACPSHQQLSRVWCRDHFGRVAKRAAKHAADVLPLTNRNFTHGTAVPPQTAPASQPRVDSRELESPERLYQVCRLKRHAYMTLPEALGSLVCHNYSTSYQFKATRSQSRKSTRRNRNVCRRSSPYPRGGGPTSLAPTCFPRKLWRRGQLIATAAGPERAQLTRHSEEARREHVQVRSVGQVALVRKQLNVPS